ncbi:hypothetical protein B0A52_02774 [Exophiala mesophila]|uniref:Enoyl reductase (ER) domain-containing protein n=1 Tax=Exophiala mesophila TaxID=212818 RepID=A0A438NDL1_EXOME|nr:hypothetical protein B0A52_02774 [Exophiala mesophila]
MASTSALPKTMLAWQKHYPGSTPIRAEVPVPSVSDDGLLIKVHAAGVCHSDVALLSMPERKGWYQEKYTLGHEGCGEIVQVGSAVSDFQVGEMVTVLSVPGCGASSCPECSNDLGQICETGEHYGIGHDGAFAPYMAIKARAAVKLPAGVSVAHGAVGTDAVMTAYHAVVGRAQVSKNDTVLLFGLGGLGFNALQILRHIGANVIVVDKRQQVLDEAVSFGVSKDNVVPIDTSNIPEWIAAKGIKVDKVIDFVGHPDTFKAGIDAVRLGGTLVLIGLLSQTVTLNLYDALPKQVNILCSFGGTHTDLRASLDLIAKGVIVPQVQLGKLADFPTILQDLHSGKIKSRIVLVPEGIENVQV